jgi:hypothetical protein
MILSAYFLVFPAGAPALPDTSFGLQAFCSSSIPEQLPFPPTQEPAATILQEAVSNFTGLGLEGGSLAPSGV